MSIKKDKYFLNLAINLAKNCLGYTGPNPAVGAVVVKDNQVVSFGNTHFSGRPHAEINALKKIDKKLLKNSTIYISLEPCSHYGKTPPCVNKIISSKIKRVVYALNDKDIRTSGKSHKILISNKIKVKKNICTADAKSVYKEYFYSKKTNKPYVYGKLAISNDYFLKDKKNFYITNDHSLKTTHILRSKVNCILTTSKTINDDNPRLSCRIKGLENLSPKIAILDKKLDIKKNTFVINNAKNKKTYLFHNSTNKKKIKLLKQMKVELIYTPLYKDKLNFNFVLDQLYVKEISSLLIEGGKSIMESFIKEDRFNEFFLFISSQKLNNNGFLKIKNVKKMLSNKFKNIKLKDTFLDNDNLIHYYK